MPVESESGKERPSQVRGYTAVKLEHTGRADLHTHTKYSGFTTLFNIPFPESIASPGDVVDQAVRKGMDVICITDHDTMVGSIKAVKYARENRLDIDVVLGEEITSEDGEILAWFIGKPIAPGLPAEETVEAIHDQGGLAVAPHPFSYHCPSLEDKIHGQALDGIEVLNAGHRDGYINRIASVNAGRLARTGGSDAHTARVVGTAYTRFEGRSKEDFYKALKRRETVPDGTTTTLRQHISWSFEVAQRVTREIIRPEYHIDESDPLYEMHEMRKRNKALAVIGCLGYMNTPIPVLGGVIAEAVLRHKGRKKWAERSKRMDTREASIRQVV
jgi:predicted metal-dependent phosphoesterase TrpH